MGRQMTVFLIRHGQKEPGKFHNTILRHQDPPLSDSGKREAEKLKGYFQNVEIRAIFVSAYQRTLHTIEPLAGSLGIQPHIDDRLNELDNGVLDDMEESEFERRYPEIWKSYRARTHDFRFPEGETGKEARERIAAFLEEKRTEFARKNIIAVSHDGLIRIGMTHILGMPVFHRGDFKVNTCGISEIEFREDVRRWRLIRLNQVL
jgi:broad specificity phosphatase PhoE